MTSPKVLLALCAAALLLSACVVHPRRPAVAVRASGEIAPGVYGRVDVSNRPPPPVVYSTPVIIEPPRRGHAGRPVYLHVPPGHAKNWRKYCHRYNACGEPVYFVKSREYEPGYERRHGHRRDRDRDDDDDRRYRRR